MSRKPWIKVCGMREPANIKVLLERIRPAYMGLILYPPSPRYLRDELTDYYARLTLPKVGVFVNEPNEVVERKVHALALQAVQLHGKESAQQVEALRQNLPKDVEIWKVASVGNAVDWQQLAAYVPFCSHLLFDTQVKGYGGSGKQFNWELLYDYPFDLPFIVSGGITENSAAKLLDLAEGLPQLVGVDINSKFELVPGLKNIAALERFSKALNKEYHDRNKS
ncbi:MAG: phosphoribosylanthranilate isomerase [Nitritalea sp.]